MAILENFQQEDRTINVPTALVPLMGGMQSIGGMRQAMMVFVFVHFSFICLYWVFRATFMSVSLFFRLTILYPRSFSQQLAIEAQSGIVSVQPYNFQLNNLLINLKSDSALVVIDIVADFEG
jgi:hypothetical protein